MARIISQRTTAATTASQAPWVNLVSSTITRTSAVVTAPRPLMIRERCAAPRTAGSPSVASARFQCRTMPIWDSVKEVKTPRM